MNIIVLFVRIFFESANQGGHSAWNTAGTW